MYIYTLKKAAQALTVSRSTLYLLIKNGELKTFNITEKRIGVLQSEINRYLVAKNENKLIAREVSYEHNS